MTTDPAPAPEPPAAEDDSYPADWLTPSQAARVATARTGDLAAQLERLEDADLLSVFTSVLAKRQAG